MYCVNCGVELHGQEEKCPLCGTPVYHPEQTLPASDSAETAEKLYSERIARSSIRVNRIKYTRTTGFVLIVMAFLCLLVNLCVSGNLSWAKFALVSLGELWAIMVLPIKFAKKLPVGKIAFILVVITCGYFVLLDWFLGFSKWSIFAGLGLLLAWVYGGMPFSQQYYYRRRLSIHLTFCMVMTAIVLVVFDLMTGNSGFSLYTAFGLACLWCYILLPLLLRVRHSVYIVLVVDYLITLVTCLMFVQSNDLSGLAVTFALSVVTLVFASGFLVVTLSKLTKFSVFGITGLAFAFSAVVMLLLNLLINRCFFGGTSLDLYAIIVAACLLPLGAFLVILEKSTKLKEYLSKKLFI